MQLLEINCPLLYLSALKSGKKSDILSKNATTFLVLGAAAVGLYFWQKVRALGNLIFSPGQPTAMVFDGSVPVMSFTVIVQNTSNQNLIFNSFAGNAFANSTFVGNVAMFQPVQVPANGQAIAVLHIRFRLLGIVQNIITAFQTKQFQQNMEIEGFANANGIQAPIKFPLTIGL